MNNKGYVIPPSVAYDNEKDLKELREAVTNLLNFICEKYKDVKCVEDWKCPHHKKLAELIDFKYKSNRERELEHELSMWQRYASYLKSCAKSGEHTPEDFDTFIHGTVWK